MNINDSDEFKVLIDALKYTSNIIVNITNKLSEQDEKINKLENTINKIYKIITSEESKIDIFMDKKNLSNSDIKKFKKFNNNTEDYSDNELDSFILEKKNIKTKNTDIKNINTKNINTKNIDIKNINTKNINTKNIDTKNIDTKNIDTKNIDSSIFKEKNKIDKLITSIIKRKKILSDIMENNKEKSLLTEHNIINSNSLDEINNKIITEPTIEFSINTAKTSCQVDTKTTSNINKEDEPKEEINKIDILKHIRKKTNFAKRF